MKTFQAPLPLGGRTCFARRNDCAGFTTTELIIVIAVIIILAALLFPVAQRARSGTESAKCINNLKQLGAAVAIYTAEHDGTYPPWLGTGTWADMLITVLNVKPQVGVQPLYCPTNLRDHPNSDGFYKHGGYYSNYAWNGSVISEVNHPAFSWTHDPTKVLYLPEPAKTFLFLDFLDTTPGAPILADISSITPGNLSCGVGFIHGGRCNVLFADYHAESLGKPLEGEHMPFKTSPPVLGYDGLR